MKTLHLERFCYSDLGTFGRLVGDSLDLVTIEPPWRDNRRFKSCIPEGWYLCERHVSPRHGETFVVRHVRGRSAILFHVANYAHELEGCIAPGLRLGALGGVWMVQDSRKAFNKLMHETHDIDAFELRVSQYGI